MHWDVEKRSFRRVLLHNVHIEQAARDSCAAARKCTAYVCPVLGNRHAVVKDVFKSKRRRHCHAWKDVTSNAHLSLRRPAKASMRQISLKVVRPKRGPPEVVHEKLGPAFGEPRERAWKAATWACAMVESGVALDGSVVGRVERRQVRNRLIVKWNVGPDGSISTWTWMRHAPVPYGRDSERGCGENAACARHAETRFLHGATASTDAAASSRRRDGVERACFSVRGLEFGLRRTRRSAEAAHVMMQRHATGRERAILLLVVLLLGLASA